MAIETVAEVAEHGRYAGGSLHLGHVARLARLCALGLAVVAVLPFLEIHLLGERADHPARRRERLCIQRVAGGAQLGLLDMGTLRLHETRHRTHDRLASDIDLIRTKNHTRAISWRGLHHELAVEAFTSTKALAGNLMADGARNAVGRELLELRAVALVERQVCEYFASAAGGARNLRRHRHVALSTLVLNDCRMHGMIDRFPAHARLPVRIPSRVGHHRGSPRGAN